MATLIPAGLGFGIALMIATDIWANPSIYLRGTFDVLAVIVGITISTLIVVGFTARHRLQQKHQRSIAQVQSQAADDRRRFFQRLDHELKNPLTAIYAGIANLAESPTQTEQDTALSSIELDVKRISRLVAKLRQLADLETTPIEWETVDITELLLEVEVEVQQGLPEAAERDITFRLPQAPWPLSTIRGDRDLLFLAIYNLVENAVKFTQPGAKIEVRALEDDQSVVIEVADTGPGIPTEEVDFVWDELYRGQSTQKTRGSGLGLALVRAIIARHRGQVGLRSRVNQGSVFTVKFPTGDVTEQ